jgi:hypothetical protein
VLRRRVTMTMLKMMMEGVWCCRCRRMVGEATVDQHKKDWRRLA